MDITYCLTYCRAHPNPCCVFSFMCCFSQEGRTALIWAAQEVHLDVVALLLDHGANIETTDNVTRGQSVMDIVCFSSLLLMLATKYSLFNTLIYMLSLRQVAELLAINLLLVRIISNKYVIISVLTCIDYPY